MKRIGRIKLAVLATTVMLLTACGEGTIGVQNNLGIFKGKTDAATLTQSNAKNLASAGLSGAAETNYLNTFSSKQKMRALNKAYAARKAAGGNRHPKAAPEGEADGEQDSTFDLGSLANGLVHSGDCGGKMTYRMDDSDGLKMSIEYDNYCEVIGMGDDDKEIQNGHVTMIALSDDEIDFDVALTIKSPTEDSSMRALMRIKEEDNGNSDIHMNMEMADAITEESLKLENIHIKETASSFALSGRVYEGDSGFVDIDTPRAIEHDSKGIPFAGKMIIKGANNSSATLEILGATYTITIDSDGDGTIDDTISGQSEELADTNEEDNSDDASDDSTSESDEENNNENNSEETATDENSADSDAEATLNDTTNDTDASDSTILAKAVDGVQDDSI